MSEQLKGEELQTILTINAIVRHTRDRHFHLITELHAHAQLWALEQCHNNRR